MLGDRHGRVGGGGGGSAIMRLAWAAPSGRSQNALAAGAGLLDGTWSEHADRLWRGLFGVVLDKPPNYGFERLLADADLVPAVACLLASARRAVRLRPRGVPPRGGLKPPRGSRRLASQGYAPTGWLAPCPGTA